MLKRITRPTLLLPLCALMAVGTWATAALAAPPHYKTELDRGRKLTKAGDYAGAVKALGRALQSRPGDARALAARGYAHLLSVPETGATTRPQKAAVAAAKADFAAAERAAAGDKRLLSAIRHNQKLLKQRSSGGRCRMKVELLSGSRVAGWEEAAAAIINHPDTGLSLEAPTDDAEAKQLVCEGCGSGPVLSAATDMDFWTVALFVPPKAAGGKLLVFPNVAVTSREYQCPPSVEIGSFKRKGKLLVATLKTSPPQVIGRNEKDEACDPDDGHDGPGGFCQRGCADGTDWTRYRVVLNPTNGKAARVSGPLTVRGTQLTSPGCASANL